MSQADDTAVEKDAALEQETQADAFASSLLTGSGDAEKAAAQGEEKEAPKENADDPADAVPDNPEGYAIDFAEGVAVDKELLGSFKAQAHSLGISQGKAQKLADFYTAQAERQAASFVKAQNDAYMKIKSGWEKEIMARPEYQAEVAESKRVLREFGSPELLKSLDESMLGSHPAVFDFFVKVGKALREPEALAGSGGAKEKPLADRLWPGMK